MTADLIVSFDTNCIYTSKAAALSDGENPDALRTVPGALSKNGARPFYADGPRDRPVILPSFKKAAAWIRKRQDQFGATIIAMTVRSLLVTIIGAAGLA